MRVLIADDHGIMRDGLRMLIGSQSDMSVVGEVESADKVVELVERTSCDVVVLDLSMPGGGGMAVISELKRATPNAHVVVLTMHEQVGYVRRAMNAGAMGYIGKRVVGTHLLTAIRSAHAGERYIDPALEHALKSEDQREGARGPDSKRELLDKLSGREMEVLYFVAKGWTNQETANRFGLSVKTVEGYRSRIKRKLGLRGRAELVRFAMSVGLLDNLDQTQD